jgi:S1-C subfamily serine protease
MQMGKIVNTVIITALFVVLALLASVRKQPKVESFEAVANRATFALFDSSNSFYCSGITVGVNGSDALGVTARHCVIDNDTNAVRQGIYAGYPADEQGPFYITTPELISETDDIAVVRIHNGADRTYVDLGDEHLVKNGDSIFNVSFPADAGKITMHGEFLAPKYDHLSRDLAGYPEWSHAMPIIMSWAPGSSGSGVFDPKQRKLIGIAAGSSGAGSFNVAEPVSRVFYLLEHWKDNTVDIWTKTHPEQKAPTMILLFGMDKK